MIVHADDFGITAKQARALLDLGDGCGGRGALESVSIFVNSPAFPEASELARPWVQRKTLRIALHLNLVEGAPCSPDVRGGDLLTDERGMLDRDFPGILLASVGPRRDALREQLVRECAAQIDRFLAAFPEQRRALRIDSHQHTHAIPLVTDALLEAAASRGCRLAHVRVPVENLRPYRACGRMADIPAANRLKNMLLTHLCRTLPAKLPAACATSAFCGVALSGAMSRMDATLAQALDKAAQAEGRQLEMLFHPVAVPREECLDPENAPFAAACASSERDEEAAVVRSLRI